MHTKKNIPLRIINLYCCNKHFICRKSLFNVKTTAADIKKMELILFSLHNFSEISITCYTNARTKIIHY